MTGLKSGRSGENAGYRAAKPEVLPEPKTVSMAGAEPERKPADVRKTVTILVADIVNSSRLSLTFDPEALQSLLARYFGEMNSIIERHGGIVERYVGDEILAMFGVPTLHEDD